MSLLDIQKFAALIPLVIILLFGAFTHFRFRSNRKEFFILTSFTAFIYILGCLLEIISQNTGEALTSMRLLQLGGSLSALLYVFFLYEYCEINLHNTVKTLLCACTLLYIIGAWTTDTTGYFYSSFDHIPGISPRSLYVRGSLYCLFRLYYLVYFLIALYAIARRMAKSDGKFRKTLVLSAVAFLLPLIAGAVEDIVTASGFALPPVSLVSCAFALSAVILHISIVKYDMLIKYSIDSFETMNVVSYALIFLDEELRYITSNDAANELFPWLKDYAPGETICFSPHWPAELNHNAFSGDEFSVTFSASDSLRYYRATAHPFISEVSRQKQWSVLIQDITAAETFVRQLEEAAYTDTLTGLYNRRHFAEIAMPFIERTKRSGMPYYIMMADLDLFKNVNDEYGHLAGDAVLHHTATIMKNTVRSYDIVARWGGEEFIFLVVDSDTDDITALAERIRERIEHNPCNYKGKELPITISFGIAQSTDEDADMTELILHADEALYKSKQNGRNRVTLWGTHE